jgi:hypothetical protein
VRKVMEDKHQQLGQAFVTAPELAALPGLPAPSAAKKPSPRSDALLWGVPDSPAASRFFGAALSGGSAREAASAGAADDVGAAEDAARETPAAAAMAANGGQEELVPKRTSILNELLKSEEEYVKRLDLLADVFVAPLMDIANGASTRSVLAGINRDEAASANAKDKKETRIVSEFVRKREVTVLLQSVKQILTVNKQLLEELRGAIEERHGHNVKVGQIFKRFAVVIKVYATFRTAYPDVVKECLEAPVHSMTQTNQGQQLQDAGAALLPSKSLGGLFLSAGGGPELGKEKVLGQFFDKLAQDKEKFIRRLGSDDKERWKNETFLNLIRFPNERIQVSVLLRCWAGKPTDAAAHCSARRTNASCPRC